MLNLFKSAHLISSIHSKILTPPSLSYFLKAPRPFKRYSFRPYLNYRSMTTSGQLCRQANILHFSLATELDVTGQVAKLQEAVARAASRSTYTVYQLEEGDFWCDVWQDVTRLFILLDNSSSGSSADVDKKRMEALALKLSDYLKQGGKLLAISVPDASKSIDYLLSLVSEASPIHSSSSLQAIKISADFDNISSQLTSSLHILDIEIQVDRDNVPDCTDFFLFSQPDQSQLLSPLIKAIFSGEDKFQTSLDGVHVSMANEIDSRNIDGGVKLFVQQQENQSNAMTFDLDSYWSHLKTRDLGKCVLFSRVLTSSYSILDGILHRLPENSGLLITSSIQTKGKGRNNNIWISNKGCAMFTFHLSLPLASSLGQRPSLFQHLTTLAIVLALKRLTPDKDYGFCIKWPNDVYVRGEGKLAGVLCKCTFVNSNLHVAIGCGINVTNPKPAICLQDVLQENTCVPSVERVTAEVMNQMEELIRLSNAENKGIDNLIHLYLDHWMHNDQHIRIHGDSFQEGLDAVISGIDSYGYLQAIPTDSPNRQPVSLHPDGNSLDMLKNCIIPKR